MVVFGYMQKINSSINKRFNTAMNLTIAPYILISI